MNAIELKLFVTLSKYLPADSTEYQVDPGTTVEMLIDELKIPKDLVKLIFVNGKKQGMDYHLCHKDRVGLFPPVGGG